MTLRTYAFTCALLLLSSLPLQAQHVEGDTVRVQRAEQTQRIRGVQYASREEAAAALAAQGRMPLFAGVSVGFDLCGAVMAVATPYGQYEGMARVNMRGKYFPTAEIGMGVSDHTNDNTQLHYKVAAPYFKVGIDYNFAKNPRSGNRIYAGLRYAFSTYKYDVDGPALKDDAYGTEQPFAFHGLRGTNHWAEALFGLEARVWGILHLGWSIRYRLRLSNKESAIGSAWYVPGYGKNDSHALGGTFHLIFDLSQRKARSK